MFCLSQPRGQVMTISSKWKTSLDAVLTVMKWAWLFAIPDVNDVTLVDRWSLALASAAFPTLLSTAL